MKPSIFYFDDDTSCLKLFCKTFGEGYDVRAATTLGEARRALAERPADIVISDQSMPEVSGREFLLEVAREHASSYRVLLSGAITVWDAAPEVGAGVAHAFVTKPWREEGMRRVLERAGATAATPQ